VTFDSCSCRSTESSWTESFYVMASPGPWDLWYTDSTGSWLLLMVMQHSHSGLIVTLCTRSIWLQPARISKYSRQASASVNLQMPDSALKAMVHTGKAGQCALGPWGLPSQLLAG